MQPFPLSDVPRDWAQRWGLPACHPGTQQALGLQPALAGLGQAPEPTLQPGQGPGDHPECLVAAPPLLLPAWGSGVGMGLRPYEPSLLPSAHLSQGPPLLNIPRSLYFPLRELGFATTLLLGVIFHLLP